MAGSRKWVIYTDDNDTQYAVNLDESNAEAAGFADVTDESTAQPLPKGFQMRYVLCREPATGASRKIYVGSRTNGVFTGLTETILLTLLGPTGLATALTAFQIVRAVGEVAVRSFAADTGLTDGDAT